MGFILSKAMQKQAKMRVVPPLLFLLFIFVLLMLACNGYLYYTSQRVKRQPKNDSPRLFVVPKPSRRPPRKVNVVAPASSSKKPPAPSAKEIMKRRKEMLKILDPNNRTGEFCSRAEEFFHPKSSNYTCETRFFMTWISPINNITQREMTSMSSVFKFNPKACLLILSNSLDTPNGTELLKPFHERGFQVAALSPDYTCLLKNTPAEAWFARLKKGEVNPGNIALGQNLSNLLRLIVLYKFGGVYVDTDMLILKSFSNLRNAVGAQQANDMGKWKELNNAVLLFDKHHPLVEMFIKEFTHRFDGSIWGHNGPRLLSRVVSRLEAKPRFNYTILPVDAFYPIWYVVIKDYFRDPGKDPIRVARAEAKVESIKKNSYAVHLWNSKSKEARIEKGSVIDRIVQGCCLFCNASLNDSIYFPKLSVSVINVK